MPLPQYSPWEEAGASVNRLGNNMQELFMGIARQNAQQRYQQQMIELRNRALQQQQAVQQQQVATGQATAGRANAAGAIDIARLLHANKFGEAMGRETPYSNPMELGEGPSINAANFDATQQFNIRDADKQRLIEASVLSGLAGNPQRASQFDLDQRAARGVPMTPSLAAAIQTKTRSMVPVGPNGLFDVVNGVMAAQGQPRPATRQAGEILSKNDALGALMKENFDQLPEEVKLEIMRTMTNNPTGGTISAPISKPTSQGQPRIPGQTTVTTPKGTFIWSEGGWIPTGQGTNSSSGSVDMNAILQGLR